MLGAFNPVERRIRLQRNAANLPIEFFQTTRRADESSGRSQDRYKMRDASLSLLPDLVRGSLIMRAPVGSVRILVGVKVKIRLLLRDFVRNPSSPIRSFSRVRKDDIC